jgi:hypothetical protein
MAPAGKRMINEQTTKRLSPEMTDFFGGEDEKEEQDQSVEGSVEAEECEEFLEEVERGKEVSNLILWRGAYPGTTIRFAISDRF